MITKFKIFETQVDSDDIMKLISEIEENNIDFVRQWIKDGYSINDPSLHMQPIMIAIDYSQEEIAKLLLDNGADLNLQDMEGWTPLMWTIIRGMDNLLISMIRKEPDLTIEDEEDKDIFDHLRTKAYLIIDNFPDQYKKYIEKKKSKEFNL